MAHDLLRLDPARRQARWRGQPLALTGRAFDLLLLLASPAGQVFCAEELNSALWPGRRMSDSNLRTQVAALRRALGPDAVQTLPGRGYRLALAAQPLAPPARSNLPCWETPLLGREREVSRLLAVLQAHRLVVIQGPGGVGKTRLAQQVAAQRRARGSCALWVDLSALASAVPAWPHAAPDAAAAAVPAIARAVARACGLPDHGLAGPEAAPRLAAALVGLGDGLLLLDNAEHLVEPLTALLQQVLQQAAALRLLVTSQRALPLPEAWSFRLDGLALPPASTDADRVAASPAVQLLWQRAAAASQHWGPQPSDAGQAAALVRALEGVPLAIELAAARLPLLGLAELSRRLHERLLGPAASAASATPYGLRHASLRATLDWSCSLLPADARAALRCLSVFAAPFRMATAAQVVGGPEIAALEHLQTLLDRSLLQPQPPADSEAPARLRMLETLRLYATESLQRSPPGERRTAMERHLVAMAALAEQACGDFYTASDAQWSACWLPDLEDFMRAFDQAHALDRSEEAAPLIEVLVLGANITGQLQPALERWQATRTLAEDASPWARARLIGWGSVVGGSNASRRRQAGQRVQAWRTVAQHDPAAQRGLALALAMQAVVCEETGDPATADRALAECEALQHPLWPARLRRRCTWLPLTRMALHRDDATLRARALVLSRTLQRELTQLGALREVTLVQVQLALMLRLQGQPLDAVAVLEQTARRQVAMGCELDAGRSHAYACAAWLEHQATSGDAPEALAEARHAAQRALQHQASHPSDIHHLIDALGCLACRLGAADVAASFLAGGVRLRQLLQVGANVLDRRMAEQVRACLSGGAGGAHPQDATTTAVPRGAGGPRGTDATALSRRLRHEALQWLSAREQATP